MSLTSIYIEGSECQMFQTSSFVLCLDFHFFFLTIRLLFHFDLLRKAVCARCFNDAHVLCSLSCLHFFFLFVIGLLFHYDLRRKPVSARLSIMLVFCAHCLDYNVVFFCDWQCL